MTADEQLPAGVAAAVAHARARGCRVEQGPGWRDESTAEDRETGRMPLLVPCRAVRVYRPDDATLVALRLAGFVPCSWSIAWVWRKPAP